MSKIPWMVVFAVMLVSLCGSGCVQRQMTIHTDPPGALVYLNDQEIGRSPVTRNFVWYGYYDVELRLPGYQSVKTTTLVIAPWWQWVPFDLLAELFRVTDHQDLYYSMQLPNERQVEADLLVKRGEELRGELMASQKPASQPTTKPGKPSHHPKTQPTTNKSK